MEEEGGCDGTPALEAESPPPQGLCYQPPKDNVNLRTNQRGVGDRKNKGKIVLLMGILYQKATKGSLWTRQIGNHTENMKDEHKALGPGLSQRHPLYLSGLLKTEGTSVECA